MSFTYLSSSHLLLLSCSPHRADVRMSVEHRACVPSLLSPVSRQINHSRSTGLGSSPCGCHRASGEGTRHAAHQLAEPAGMDELASGHKPGLAVLIGKRR